MSKATDVASGGRHMSNHFAKPSIGIQNVSSCVSNHSQHAAGLARAIKTYKQGRASSSARSASPRPPRATSTRRSTALRARSFRSSSSSRTTATASRSPRATRRRTCTRPTTSPASRTSRSSTATASTSSTRSAPCARPSRSSAPAPGAAIVHATCVRIHSHSNSDRQELYRTPEELAEAHAADPLPRFREAAARDRSPARRGARRRSRLRTSRPTKKRPTAPRRRPTRTPRRSTTSSPPSPGFRRPGPRALPDGSGEEMTLVHALNETLKEEFRHNPDTYIWGQDVAYRDKGGVFNVTKGMQQEFGPARVFNAPDRRGPHHGHGRRVLPPRRAHPHRRRRRGVRRLLLAGGRADGRDVARVLAHEGPVRAQRDGPPAFGRLHRRRPLPLPEPRGLARRRCPGSASSFRRSPTTPRGFCARRSARAASRSTSSPSFSTTTRWRRRRCPSGVRRAVRQGARAPRRAPT